VLCEGSSIVKYIVAPASSTQRRSGENDSSPHLKHYPERKPPMSFIPIQRMWERFEISVRDSDTAGFFDLMYLGELVLKTTVLGFVAALESDKDRHQYQTWLDS
jgi:hypothetical protein